eukprot:scaffold1122_cov50-Phaeocystis_antarctica.AAC.8
MAPAVQWYGVYGSNPNPHPNRHPNLNPHPNPHPHPNLHPNLNPHPHQVPGLHPNQVSLTLSRYPVYGETLGDHYFTTMTMTRYPVYGEIFEDHTLPSYHPHYTHQLSPPLYSPGTRCTVRSSRTARYLVITPTILTRYPVYGEIFEDRATDASAASVRYY